MANNNSAKKRIQIAERNRLENKNYKSTVRTLMKRCFVACDIFEKEPGDESKSELQKTFNLAFTQGPFVSLMMIIPFFIFYFYKIDRKRHNEIISEIKKKL